MTWYFTLNGYTVRAVTLASRVLITLMVNAFPDLISVTAADRYTIVFQFKTANQASVLWTLYNFSLAQCMENSDAVQQWGDVSDWHHAIGTGPFILKDFIPHSLHPWLKTPIIGDMMNVIRKISFLMWMVSGI